MKFLLFTSLVTLGLVLPTSAQNLANDQSPKYTLKEGTDVELTFADGISSKTATVDERVNFQLDKDLKIGDAVIAKQNSKAVGTVVHVKKAGMLGKGGELNVRLDYLIVGDNRIRLRATKDSQGSDKVGTAVALTVLFGPIGLIKHGKDIEIKPGSSLKGYVDQDVLLPSVQ